MKLRVWILCVLLLLSLGGCTFSEVVQNPNMTDTSSIDELVPIVSSSVEAIKSPSEFIPLETESPYIFQFYESSYNGPIKEGMLIHTVLDMRTIKNTDNLSLDGKFADFKPVCIYSDDGDETVYYYPDFVDKAGQFVENIELLLLTISIKSDNAHSWTSSDIDENPYVGGMYSDPYIFRIDGLYGLQEECGSVFSFGATPAFFSELNSVDEHPFAYRLEPGEEIVVTIGFLIGDDPSTGEHRDYSTMRIRIPGGGEEYFINLSEEHTSHAP